MFEDILLPDSNINEPASHGYIQFSIDHLPNAPVGTVIENSASIYFDFNPPIKTNTTINTLHNSWPTALGSVGGIVQTYLPNLTNGVEEINNSKFTIYPNPAREVIQITTEDYRGNDILLEWVDLLGYSLHEEKVKIPMSNYTFQHTVPNVTPGIYFLRINKKYTKKIIIN